MGDTATACVRAGAFAFVTSTTALSAAQATDPPAPATSAPRTPDHTDASTPSHTLPVAPPQAGVAPAPAPAAAPGPAPPAAQSWSAPPAATGGPPAAAQPGPIVEYPAPGARGEDPSAKEPPADVRHTDAHLDRVIVLPTAETHPEGTLYFSSYDILLLQAGYALTDRTQLTLTATPPLTDGIFPVDLTLKAVMVRGELFRVAALGSVSGIVGLDEGNFFLGRVGGVGQFCFESECRSSVSFGTTVILGGPATMAATGAGLVWRAANFFSLLVEVVSLVPLGSEISEVNGIAAGPGVRFSWSDFGIDVAVEVPLDAELDDEEAPPVIPIIALTYRFLP